MLTKHLLLGTRHCAGHSTTTASKPPRHPSAHHLAREDKLETPTRVSVRQNSGICKVATQVDGRGEVDSLGESKMAQETGNPCTMFFISLSPGREERRNISLRENRNGF